VRLNEDEVLLLFSDRPWPRPLDDSLEEESASAGALGVGSTFESRFFPFLSNILMREVMVLASVVLVADRQMSDLEWQ
jgi:hypothetical protein